MTFDDHLRDELRHVTQSQPIDADTALDAVKTAPLAVLEDAALPRPRHARTRRLIGVAATIALVAGAIALPFALRNDGTQMKDAKKTPHRSSKSSRLHVDPKALAAVHLGARRDHHRRQLPRRVHDDRAAADDADDDRTVPHDERLAAEGGRPSVMPVCSISTPHDVKTTGIATVNVDPYALISVSNVSNFGDVTVARRFHERVGGGWRRLRARPGPRLRPRSVHVGLRRPASRARSGSAKARAMMGLASPYGYLHVVKSAIVGAETVGAATVNGEPVTVSG